MPSLPEPPPGAHSAPRSASADPSTVAAAPAPEESEALARLGLPREALPRHVAMIMDGNGRWAQRRGLPRVFGHREGAKTVQAVVAECARLGIEVLTLYSFSIENWKRPAEEVGFLMELYVEYLAAERRQMMENNIRFAQIGRREGLPGPVLAELDRTLAETAGNTGMTLVLAVNYGSRAEITDAARAIADAVRRGEIAPEGVTEEIVAAHLYTRGLPDPDLLIRTAGEMRLSNYLLWQISYAELVVSDLAWPDFGVEALHDALREYARRDRRFGGVAV